jgi:hypothetical protein
MMQIDRAAAAAGCGLLYEALDAALEAIRGFATSNALLERGEDFLSSRIDPLEVWHALSEEQQRQAENELFWMVIAPLVLGALVARRGVGVVETWVRQFAKCKGTLLNARYWEEVLETSRLVLSPAPREGTIQKINALPGYDVAMRLMLYLALSQATGSVPSEALRAHSVILGVLLDRKQAASIVLENSFLIWSDIGVRWQMKRDFCSDPRGSSSQGWTNYRARAIPGRLVEFYSGLRKLWVNRCHRKFGISFLGK